MQLCSSLSTPVLLLGKSHGRRSLVGCSPWGRWESDKTEWLHFHFSLSCIGEGNGNPLWCSCLENPGDGGAWWAAVYGVAKSRTGLKWLSSSNWTFFGIAFLGEWNQNWPFQVCSHCRVFQICWHIECRTFTGSPFRIWNSSAGVPSPLLGLFVVMFPKTHLTSHSRMSGSRWAITSSWLSTWYLHWFFSLLLHWCIEIPTLILFSPVIFAVIMIFLLVHFA